ncbi:MAG: OadG family protein [Sporomusaceae bacterium]|nr:OadG family protein [Sporomusaceae bacterium]
MMGFFDSLFGGKKAGATKKAKPAAAAVVAPAVEASGTGGLAPEIVAAISAGVNMVMSDDAELIAAISAAVVHAGGGGAVRFKRSAGNAWAVSGRQRIMDGRQSL